MKDMICGWSMCAALFSALVAFIAWNLPADASDSGTHKPTPQRSVWEELSDVISKRSDELTLQERADLRDGIEKAKLGPAVGMVSTSVTQTGHLFFHGDDLAPFIEQSKPGDTISLQEDGTVRLKETN